MIDLTGPPRPWSDRLTARYASCQEHALRTPGWWRPPGWWGEPRLLERLAELFGAPVERTVVNGGVRQFATSWAVRASVAVVETPSYADIPVILGSRTSVRRVPWRALTAGAIEPPGTIWLTSPYRNPDGRCLDPALLAAAARLAGRGHTVVANQVYRWFDGATAMPPVPAGAWTVTSLAKIAGNGIRLGWATAPSPDAITRTLTSDGPPTAWQWAWARFLTRQNFQALWTDCVEPTLAARQAFARRAGELLGWDVPGRGPCLLLACVGIPEATGVELLAGRGLRVSPGSAFGSPVDSVRLSFSGTTAAQAHAAAEAMARVATRLRPADRF